MSTKMINCSTERFVLKLNLIVENLEPIRKIFEERDVT
jgi:hypothetical protein